MSRITTTEFWVNAIHRAHMIREWRNKEAESMDSREEHEKQRERTSVRKIMRESGSFDNRNMRVPSKCNSSTRRTLAPGVQMSVQHVAEKLQHQRRYMENNRFAESRK